MEIAKLSGASDIGHEYNRTDVMRERNRGEYTRTPPRRDGEVPRARNEPLRLVGDRATRRWRGLRSRKPGSRSAHAQADGLTISGRSGSGASSQDVEFIVVCQELDVDRRAHGLPRQLQERSLELR